MFKIIWLSKISLNKKRRKKMLFLNFGKQFLDVTLDGRTEYYVDVVHSNK